MPQRAAEIPALPWVAKRAAAGYRCGRGGAKTTPRSQRGLRRRGRVGPELRCAAARRQCWCLQEREATTHGGRGIAERPVSTRSYTTSCLILAPSLLRWHFLRALDYRCQALDDLQDLAVGVLLSSLLRVHDDPAGPSVTVAFEVIDGWAQADTYRFPGFRPHSTVRGVSGDSKVRILRLQRRGKKPSVAPVGVASEREALRAGHSRSNLGSVMGGPAYCSMTVTTTAASSAFPVIHPNNLPSMTGVR